MQFPCGYPVPHCKNREDPGIKLAMDCHAHGRVSLPFLDVRLSLFIARKRGTGLMPCCSAPRSELEKWISLHSSPVSMTTVGCSTPTPDPHSSQSPFTGARQAAARPLDAGTARGTATDRPSSHDGAAGLLGKGWSPSVFLGLLHQSWKLTVL